MEDMGNLDRIYHHFRQRLLASVVSNNDTEFWTPYPGFRMPPIPKEEATNKDREDDCLSKVVPDDDTDIWTPSQGISMPPILQGCTNRDGGYKQIDRETDHSTISLISKFGSIFPYIKTLGIFKCHLSNLG